jgi:1-acyl-sn-glycerol-3-phosphate acyltransferase
VGRFALWLGGWKIAGSWPTDARMVVTAAPHTSNWDGIWMLAAAGAWRVRLRYMGKKSLTQGPFGWLVRWTGCIPIDRSQSNDVVAAMKQAFDVDSMFLVVPPEGTRSAVEKWKSGFYHIAVGAQVPLIVGMMDYAKKTGGLALAFMPTGDYAADMARVEEFYRSTTPKHPGQAMKSIMAASVQSAEHSTIDKAA